VPAQGSGEGFDEEVFALGAERAVGGHDLQQVPLAVLAVS
jgi:hypothetical protein